MNGSDHPRNCSYMVFTSGFQSDTNPFQDDAKSWRRNYGQESFAIIRGREACKLSISALLGKFYQLIQLREQPSKFIDKNDSRGRGEIGKDRYKELCSYIMHSISELEHILLLCGLGGQNLLVLLTTYVLNVITTRALDSRILTLSCSDRSYVSLHLIT